MNKDRYLDMQRSHYEDHGARWSLDSRDYVVGSYDQHNQWIDYDTLLFKDIDTTTLTALEYGCGPGRNLIRFAPRFTRVDGVDIAQNNLDKAQINLAHNGVTAPSLYKTDGSTLPMIAADTYDVVFSVICLQHICCYDIRFSIFQEIHRVLKLGGHFCFQIGFGGRPDNVRSAGYYDNVFDAPLTNGGYDFVVDNETDLIGDLIDRIGFHSYRSIIAETGPGDNHKNWIWVQVQK
jgi:SAM-dependent methyltransferase